MDKLFTNIQQTFSQLNPNPNTNSNQDLLNRQQISQEKINELLEQSSQALLCGPECQKLKVGEELKQKYLDAETNVKTAPVKLEQSKKNYYVFTEGRPYYDNMMETELKEKAKMIAKMLTENFENELTNANTMNSYLNTALINSENTKELLEEYLVKNQTLKTQLSNRRGDILTNDRKTYYETEATERVQMWYSFLWYIYYILILVLLLAFLFSPSNLPMYKKIAIFTVFLFYPYYVSYVVNWITETYRWFSSKLPKNVYNNL